MLAVFVVDVMKASDSVLGCNDNNFIPSLLSYVIYSLCKKQLIQLEIPNKITNRSFFFFDVNLKIPSPKR